MESLPVQCDDESVISPIPIENNKEEVEVEVEENNNEQEPENDATYVAAKGKDYMESEVELTFDEHEINRQWHRLEVPMGEDRPYTSTHIRRYTRGFHEPMLEDYYFTDRAFIKFSWDNLLFKLKTFLFVVVCFQTALIVVLSIGTTLFCYYLDLSTDLPLSLVSVSILFPISFGISFNFSRREATLR